MKWHAITRLANRDRWLLALVPGLIAMAAYVFVFDRPSVGAIRDLDAKVDAARKQASPAEQIQVQRDELARLNDSIRLRRSSSAASARQVTLKNWSTPAERPAVLAEIGRWLEMHNVAVAACARLSNADGKTHGAAWPKEWLQQASATDRATPPESWKIDLVCDYGAMQAVLRALPLLDRVVVLLELSMEKAERNTPLRHWSLVIAI